MRVERTLCDNCCLSLTDGCGHHFLPVCPRVRPSSISQATQGLAYLTYRFGIYLPFVRTVEVQSCCSYGENGKWAKAVHIQLKPRHIDVAQNRLSSVNRTMAALRGDQYVKIPSPSKALGLKRSSVRREAPQGQDRAQVELIARALSERGRQRVGAIVHLARETGMRLREAILLDLPRLQREAWQLGKINIQDGTKGGRSGASAPCWITVTDQVRDALERAYEASPTGSRNLLAPDESYKDFLQSIVRPVRDILHEHGLKGFHELRAAYACERYEQLTGFPAPVNGGRVHREDRELDQRARQQISHELGHSEHRA